MIYTQLALTALCPVVVSASLYLLGRRNIFSGWKYWQKQIFYGVIFGAVAVLATEFGIPIDGAVINARDAAPLCAGLIFGAPAGIITGFIGGAERYFASWWGAGFYTQIACSVSTVLAGFLAAVLREVLFDNKKPAWYYGLAAAVVMEILHMLMIFLTNMNDVHQAFIMVEKCAAPMIAVNGAAVMMAVLAVTILGRERLRPKKGRIQLAQSFSRWLLACVMLAFTVSSLFIFVLQTRLAVDDAQNMLKLYIDDVRADINDASDANLLKITQKIRDTLAQEGYSEEVLNALMNQYDVSEINVIDSKGLITHSTTSSYIGFNMRSGSQSNEFMVLTQDKDYLVQQYQAITYASGIFMKYAGMALSDGGFVQVGYNSARFQADIDEQVVGITRNRHVGENGFILITDEDFNLVSDPSGNEGQNLDVTGIWLQLDNAHKKAEEGMVENAGDLLYETVYNISCYAMYDISEGYYIIGVMPESEVVFTRNISVYITIFIEILVFALLFFLIYFLVKNLVVDNIQRINSALGEITGGNLNVSVDVRSNEEFASLSEDINSTVQTLKGYIAEASARIDKELEFAKTIQSSALPGVFPAFPERDEFDIYATMDAAREVGGDFYDFYFLDGNRLAFLIADVSGKGISAAMFMMKAKTVIKGYAEKELDLSEVMNNANNELCKNNEAQMFVTCWMGVLDLVTGVVRFVNAGHNRPLIRREGEKFEYLNMRPNFVLGGMEGVSYRMNELKLNPGDEIFLYTDGVTEAVDSNDAFYGDERLKLALDAIISGDAESVCNAVKMDMDAFVGKAAQFDDITMLSLKITPRKRLSVIPISENMEQVITFIETVSKENGLPIAVSSKISIAADEIFSNIIQYSGASESYVECVVKQRQFVLIFTDNGKPYNPMERSDPDTTLTAEEREIGGLGIYMVKKTMDQVSYEYREGFNILTIKKQW